MEEIFLKKNGAIDGVNTKDSLKVNLDSSYRLFPIERIKENFDLSEEYNLERDYCQEYRIILGISPYCSNVLYNRHSEIIKDEGSSETCKCINFSSENALSNNFSQKNIDAAQAIRDTEYSHKELGGYTYHCGLDIFNNHRFRSKDFITINSLKYNSKERDNFNSIGDIARDEKGKEKKEVITYIDSQDKLCHKTINPHVYTLDNIMPFKEAFEKKIVSRDGWYGFINETSINIDNYFYKNNGNFYGYKLNKILNNNKPCEQIDFYPDRSLFSFIPKINKFKMREEANWDYCLTYPSKSDYHLFNKINDDIENKVNGIKVLYCFILNEHSTNKKVLLRTKIRHGLKPGNLIRLYFEPFGKIKKNGEEKENFIESIRVEQIGDIRDNNRDKEYYFTISFNDVKDIVKDDNSFPELYIKREINSYPCEYYFRIFTKLKKINILDETEKDLVSYCNKEAFAQTLFGDKKCEIIFTDSVNVSNLKDNRGRDISEIFLTILKRHKGNEKWYRYHSVNSDDIEFSHCFGKLTSGLDMIDLSKNYNVHAIHNVDLKDGEGMGFNWEKYIKGAEKYFEGIMVRDKFGDLRPPQTLQENEDITIGQDDFLGDIVEYSPSEDKEKTIEKVYFRFNTEQREMLYDSTFFEFNVDNISKDDYDNFNGIDSFGLTVENLAQNGKDFIPSNVCPEGYFYSPHYLIKLKEYKDWVRKSQGFLINVNEENFIKDEECGVFTIKAPMNLGFAINDKIFLYDKENEKNLWGRIISIKNNLTIKIKLNEKSFTENEWNSMVVDDFLNRYELIFSLEDVPEYAFFLHDTEKRFIWREINNFSELSNESELYNIPFSNGCLYIEKEIPFFLKRQDPFGIYNLRNVGKRRINMDDYIQEEEKFNNDKEKYISTGKCSICG